MSPTCRFKLFEEHGPRRIDLLVRVSMLWLWVTPAVPLHFILLSWVATWAKLYLCPWWSFMSRGAESNLLLELHQFCKPIYERPLHTVYNITHSWCDSRWYARWWYARRPRCWSFYRGRCWTHHRRGRLINLNNMIINKPSRTYYWCQIALHLHAGAQLSGQSSYQKPHDGVHRIKNRVFIWWRIAIIRETA